METPESSEIKRFGFMAGEIKVPDDFNTFDRLLIAQATVEGITLLTNDAVVAQYLARINRL